MYKIKQQLTITWDCVSDGSFKGDFAAENENNSH